MMKPSSWAVWHTPHAAWTQEFVIFAPIVDVLPVSLSDTLRSHRTCWHLFLPSLFSDGILADLGISWHRTDHESWGCFQPSFTEDCAWPCQPPQTYVESVPHPPNRQDALQWFFNKDWIIVPLTDPARLLLSLGLPLAGWTATAVVMAEITSTPTRHPSPA